MGAVCVWAGQKGSLARNGQNLPAVFWPGAQVSSLDSVRGDIRTYDVAESGIPKAPTQSSAVGDQLRINVHLGLVNGFPPPPTMGSPGIVC